MKPFILALASAMLAAGIIASPKTASTGDTIAAKSAEYEEALRCGNIDNLLLFASFDFAHGAKTITQNKGIKLTKEQAQGVREDMGHMMAHFEAALSFASRDE